MNRLLVFVLTLVLITACGQSEPPFIDNGKPGQIKVTVFYDDNSNGIMDTGESGAPQRIQITQEASCISNPPNFVPTDPNGIILFSELEPGQYCVAIANGYGMTTKMNYQVYVSSDMVTMVYFGVIKEQ
jgi:uncharacterized protein (DUF2141 family)